MFSIPARGLIGLRTRLLNATQGTADHPPPLREATPRSKATCPSRANGVLVSMIAGQVVAFGLDTLQERAEMFVAPGDEVYEGMIVGENSRNEDMSVNPTKEKKLTNMRATGTDGTSSSSRRAIMSLEAALEYIEEDELVEVTPTQIRLRKKILKETDRKRASRRRGEVSRCLATRSSRLAVPWERSMPFPLLIPRKFAYFCRNWY